MIAVPNPRTTQVPERRFGGRLHVVKVLEKREAGADTEAVDGGVHDESTRLRLNSATTNAALNDSSTTGATYMEYRVRSSARTGPESDVHRVAGEGGDRAGEDESRIARNATSL